MYHVFKGYADRERHDHGGQYEDKSEAHTMAERAVTAGYDWALVVYIWLESRYPSVTYVSRVVCGKDTRQPKE